MISVSKIAGLAINSASKAISDAVHPASLSYDLRGAYNPTTGVYATTTITIGGGTAVLDMKTPIADNFPDYTAGPTDKAIFLHGFTVVPQENWLLTFNGSGYTIRRVLDIMDAHTTFSVVAS